MARFFRILFGAFFIALVLYVVISVRPYSVSWDSMQPTLEDAQIVLIDRISLKFQPLSRGEIVVYRDMNNDGEIKVKRVLGLPREKIEIADGKVMIDKKEIEERYLEEHIHTCLPGACTDLSSHIFDIPQASYFVLGDNRGVSRDSRWCQDVADCQNKKPLYIPDREILWRVFFSW